jgi:hypothetical protein
VRLRLATGLGRVYVCMCKQRNALMQHACYASVLKASCKDSIIESIMMMDGK